MANMGLLTNVGLHVGGYNLTGITNVARMNIVPEIRDHNVFGVNAKTRAYGMEEATLEAAGFLDTALEVDREFWGVSTPVSLFLPATGSAAIVAGDRAFFFNAMNPNYTRGGTFGQDATFRFAAQSGPSSDRVGCGYVLNPGLVAVSADGGATGLELGAVAAGKYLYAILHVEEVSASDSIVVTIESSVDNTFAAPTTQITFASKSAIGAEYAVKVAGPITDTWWRAYHNVTGAAVSIKYAAAIAIL